MTGFLIGVRAGNSKGLNESNHGRYVLGTYLFDGYLLILNYCVIIRETETKMRGPIYS